MTTWYEKREDIAVLQIDHPPVNGLNAATRAAMADGLRKASSDHKVSAIIITGTGTVFSGGADIREFGTQAALAQPDLLALLDRVESCNKPVIAVINGVCMGGGLELALACHYRIATADAVMALPEVKIGLIPGAGGTQRLPRAVGAEKALNMIVSGQSIKAEEALDNGLVERIVINTSFSEAMDFAHEVAERRSRPKLRFKEASLPPGVDSDQFFEQARSRVAAQAGGLQAPMACVEAVEAAVTLPFAQGMECEQRLFAERVVSTESKALRHMFFAQRAAARLPDLSPEALTARPLHGVAVLGFGTMGSDIAMALAASGFEVVIYDNNAVAVSRSMAACRAQWERDARQGKLTLPEVDAQMALLKPTLRIEDLSQLDLVIEAVHEDLSLKQSVFAQLGRLMKPGAVLASNTAMLDVDQIAHASGRAADVVGLHFISPVREKPLIEVVRGKKTAPDTLGTAMALAKRLKKVAVVSGVCDGFIGNRMLEQYLHQAYLLVDEGASPSQVDEALKRFGMNMGPFELSDQLGLDVGYAVRQRRYREKPQLTRALVADQLVHLGRLGLKSAKGWYDYDAQLAAQPSAQVQALIEAHRRKVGIIERDISDEQIVDRCVLALVNEGARLLDEGIAQRASDIDVIYVLGYGFPAGKGGPMFYAEHVARLSGVLEQIRRFAANPNAEPKFWSPAKALLKAAQLGRWPSAGAG